MLRNSSGFLILDYEKVIFRSFNSGSIDVQKVCCQPFGSYLNLNIVIVNWYKSIYMHILYFRIQDGPEWIIE